MVTKIIYLHDISMHTKTTGKLITFHIKFFMVSDHVAI